MHLNDGQLRASLDQEGSAEELRHLETCSRCRERQAEILRVKQITGGKLSFLADAEKGKIPAASYELARLKDRVTEKENRMQNIFKFFRRRLVWGSAATIVLVAAFLSVPTMRAAAAELLAMFRVQQVAALPLDSTGLTNFSGDENLSKKMTQIMSESVVQTRDSGDPRVVSSVDEANQNVGFSVRLPSSETVSPVLYVQGAMGYEINIDRAKAQAFIDETGRTDIVLPENIDGRQITVDIPAGLTAAYGECPQPDEVAEPVDPDEPGSTARLYPNCVMLAEYPSPTVVAPEDLDIGQLVELGLQFSGMNEEEAAQIRNSIDWTTTLVIPIPRNASTYEQVSVDGVSGTLVQQSTYSPHYLLVWVKDGIIYCISGWGTETSRAVEAANSLQ